MPCLAATYAGDPANPLVPRIEDMFTIAPAPASAITGSSKRSPWKTPVRLVAMTRFQAAMSYSPVGSEGPPMPALFTARSSEPKVSVVKRTAPWTESGSVTSTTTGSARAPAVSSSPAASWAPSSS